MQVQLKQTEIVAALKLYINVKGINLDGKLVDVSFTAGRKEDGLIATVSIDDPEEEPGAVTKTPAPAAVASAPAASAAPAPAPKAAEVKAAATGTPVGAPLSNPVNSDNSVQSSSAEAPATQAKSTIGDQLNAPTAPAKKAGSLFG